MLNILEIPMLDGIIMPCHAIKWYVFDST